MTGDATFFFPARWQFSTGLSCQACILSLVFCSTACRPRSQYYLGTTQLLWSARATRAMGGNLIACSVIVMYMQYGDYDM